MESTSLELDKAPAAGPLIGADLGKARAWQVLALVSVAALAFVYRNTFEWWWAEWWKSESYYSHGVLIPFLSAFVIYCNWRRIAKARVEPNPWGLAVLLPAIFVHFVSHRGGVPSVAGLTFPLALTGAVLFLFGTRIARELVFPLLFLFFMTVPPTMILDKISFKIQMLSTTAATMGLKLMSFDAVQNGTKIGLPNIEVVVGAPCSGFRMLIALLAFTVFFVYGKSGPMWGRLALVVFVLPLSLVANSIRVLMIALVGEFWGDEAMHTFHDYSGYIVLAIAFLILVQLAKLVKCPDFRAEFEAGFDGIAGAVRAFGRPRRASG